MPAPPPPRLPVGPILAAVGGLAVVAAGVFLALRSGGGDDPGPDDQQVTESGWTLEDPDAGLPCTLVGMGCPALPPERSFTVALGDSLARVLPVGSRLNPESVRFNLRPDGSWTAEGEGVGTARAFVLPLVPLTISEGPDVLRRNAARLRVHAHPGLEPGYTVDQTSLRVDERPARTRVTWSGRAVRGGGTWRIDPDGEPEPIPVVESGPGGRDSLRLDSRARVDQLVSERDSAIADVLSDARSTAARIERYRRGKEAAVPVVPGRSGGCPRQEITRHVQRIQELGGLCPTLGGARYTDCRRELDAQNTLLRECQLRRGTPGQRDDDALAAARRDADDYARSQWARFERRITGS